MTKQAYQLQQHNKRLAGKQATRAERKLAHKLFMLRIRHNIATLCADVRKEVQPALQVMRDVDNFIASGRSTLLFGRENNTPRCPVSEMVY